MSQESLLSEKETASLRKIMSGKTDDISESVNKSESLALLGEQEVDSLKSILGGNGKPKDDEESEEPDDLQKEKKTPYQWFTDFISKLEKRDDLILRLLKKSFKTTILNDVLKDKIEKSLEKEEESDDEKESSGKKSMPKTDLKIGEEIVAETDEGMVLGEIVSINRTHVKVKDESGSFDIPIQDVQRLSFDVVSGEFEDDEFFDRVSSIMNTDED